VKMKLPDGSKTAGRVYAKCIMDFENRIKSDFRNNGQKWAVDVGIEAEFPEAGIEEGYMTFTNEEILRCFEPVVNRILELVRNQIIAIQAQNRTLQVSTNLVRSRGVEEKNRKLIGHMSSEPPYYWRVWCFRVLISTDSAPRSPSVPKPSRQTHEFRNSRCQRRCHNRNLNFSVKEAKRANLRAAGSCSVASRHNIDQVSPSRG